MSDRIGPAQIQLIYQTPFRQTRCFPCAGIALLRMRSRSDAELLVTCTEMRRPPHTVNRRVASRCG